MLPCRCWLSSAKPRVTLPTMSTPVRPLHPRDVDAIAAACRALGIDPAAELCFSEDAVQVRAQVVRRGARPGAATVLLVPASADDVGTSAGSAVEIARALGRSGARAIPVLARTACAADCGAAATRALALRGLLDDSAGVLDGFEVELALDLGLADGHGGGLLSRAGWMRALEPQLAISAGGDVALLGGGTGAVVGPSLLAEQIARRCGDWIVVPSAPGPLGVHHAVEVRGRRLGVLPAAVVIRSPAGALAPSGEQAVRAARLQGLEAAVWFDQAPPEPIAAGVRRAGAGLVCSGASASARLADWLQSIRSVGVGSGCFLGSRMMPSGARVRRVVERVLGGSLLAGPDSWDEFESREGDWIFDARTLGGAAAPVVRVGNVRWCGSPRLTCVELCPVDSREG